MGSKNSSKNNTKNNSNEQVDCDTHTQSATAGCKKAGNSHSHRRSKNKQSRKSISFKSFLGSKSKKGPVLPVLFRVTVANTGDSKALLICKNGNTLKLTKDHKPVTPSEMDRIEQAGGVVLRKRVNGDLAVSRAFGDSRHKRNNSRGLHQQAVIATPDISTTTARQGDVLLLACDGVFEQLTEDQVASFVREELRREGPLNADIVAGKLLDYSLYRGSKDNQSCCLVVFREQEDTQNTTRPARAAASNTSIGSQKSSNTHKSKSTYSKSRFVDGKHKKTGMRYQAGRLTDWKDNIKFLKAYNAYAYSCGVVGRKIHKFAPNVCDFLEFLMLSISANENPFGIVMLILEYTDDPYRYLYDMDTSNNKVRNHIDGKKHDKIRYMCC